MKNLKKVLAMVLAFACTFTMFASAKVYEDVPAGSDYSEAITMLSDLGIIQGKTDSKYHPKDTITRAEACALIARLMTGDPNAAGFNGAHHFKDVPAGYWASSAIGYCVVNGIAIGVDQAGTRFEPNRPIKDKEFVTMIVRALGYETPDMRNNFPFGYMSAARAIGLLQDVNMVPETDALRDEDAQIIYNAMFVDYARGAKRVNVAHGTSVESYPTLAESVWHLDRAAVGTWDKKDKDDETATLTNCKAHTWVVVGHDPRQEDHILAYPIEDESTELYDSKDKNAFRAYSFKYEGDIDSIKGYKVELWGAGKHGTPTWEKADKDDKDSKNGRFVWSEDWTIKAIKTVKGQNKFDYNPSMADKKDDNGEIELNEETKLDLDTVAKNASNITSYYHIDQYVTKKYNDTEIGAKDDKKVEKALNIRDGAQYKLMDWDSDGDVDWVVVDEAHYFKVETVNSKRATVVSMQTGSPDEETQTKSDSETWKLDGITEIKGVKYDFKAEGLKEGDIVQVVYSTAYNKDEKDPVITATVSVVDAENHKLEKVSTKGGLTLTFDDKEIKVAQNNDKGDVIVPENPTKYREFNSEELGTEFALRLNRNGFIVHSDYATETANYAMVLDAANGKDQAGDRNLAKVDLLLGDNTVKEDVELTSGATIENAKGEDDAAAYDDRAISDNHVVGNVYKYWTNEKGQITRMQAMFDDDDVTNKTENSDYNYKSSTDRLSDQGSKYVASLEEADVIFAVKEHTKNAESYIQHTADRGLFVDSNDVIAVKAKDIPDIGTGEDTKPSKLNKEDAHKTWLRVENTEYNNTFVSNKDGNKAGVAAILGVNNFNKFGVTNTKLGLVTDVSFVNTSEGRYVEVEAAVDGENKKLESAKKIDFDSVVKAYKADDKSDIGVKNESSKVDNKMFGNKEFDKYLEKNAAYAEITTDADGKLTKVTFLDMDTATNKAVGHYYTVSRNVVTDSKSKSFQYIQTGEPVYYQNSSKLYSVDRMPIEDSAVSDDTKYYTIDERPTINSYASGVNSYDNAKLTISNGFDGTPDIKPSDKAGMLFGKIDNQYDSDTYYVADIAFNNDDDIVAMYSFEKDLGEVASKDVVTANTTVAGQPGNTIKAGGDAMTVTLKTVGGQGNTTVTVGDAYLKGDDKKAPVAGITVTPKTVTATAAGDTFTVKADRTVAAGTYVVELKAGDNTQYLEFTVTAADAQNVDKVVFTNEQGKELKGLDNTATKLFFKVLDASGDMITDIDTNNVVVYRGIGQEAGFTVVKTRTPGLYQINLATAVGTDEMVVEYGGKSAEGTGAVASVTVAAPSKMKAFATAEVKAKITVAGAIPDAGWTVEVKDASNNTIPAVITNSEVVIKPTGLTKAGSYTITVTAGTTTGTATLTVEKEKLAGTVSDITTKAATFKVTVTDYATLDAKVQAEINKINAATATGATSLTSSQTVKTFTTANDGTFNGELSANPDAAGEITITATVSANDYFDELKFTGTVGA